MRTFEPTHVLHDTDDRHFAVFAKRHRLARIQQRHLLRSRDDDGPADVAQQVDGGHRFVSSSGRQIDQEEVQVLPFDSAQQLVDELVLVGITPDDGIIGVLQQKRHGGNLEVVGLKRNDAARGADLELLSFGANHFRDVGTVNVHVANADMPSLERQTHCEIRRAGAFSHPALVAHDEDFVLDPLHPLGDQPAAVPFLVLLTRFVLVANRTGPHVRAGIAAAGRRSGDHIEFARHRRRPFLAFLSVESEACPAIAACRLRWGHRGTPRRQHPTWPAP